MSNLCASEHMEYKIKYKLCALMHQIHTGRAPQYLAHSVQLIAESSRRSGLRSVDTADCINFHMRANSNEIWYLVNVASVALVQHAWNISLHDSVKPTRHQ